jgi:hypothetical protein
VSQIGGGAMHYFEMMSEADRLSTIYRMAKNGWRDYAIAAATKLSVASVRKILGERPAA